MLILLCCMHVPSCAQAPAAATMTCAKCNREKPLTDMKGGSNRDCNACYNKRSLLSQMFGKWPIAPFEELAKEAKEQFWQGDRSSKHELNKLLIGSLSAQRSKVEQDIKGGTFKPLSVYEREGYETDNIEANSEKRWDDELQVYTYKLATISQFEKKCYKEVSDLVWGMRKKDLKSKLSHYCSPRDKEASRKRGRSRSRGASSSAGSRGGTPEREPTKEEIAAQKKAAAKAAALAKKNAFLAKKAEAAAKKKEAQAARKAEQTAVGEAKKKAKQDGVAVVLA